MKNYTELDKILQGRNHDSKKYANNTYLQRRGDNIALKYHDTDVVTVTPSNDIILNSGGWHTSTTKDRISYMVRIYQESGVWYVPIYDNIYRFNDGMTIHNDGTVTGAGIDDLKADKELKKRVKAYAQLCANSVPLEQPSSGDCWYCCMVTESGEALGDAFKDTSHLDYHMKEGYVVPSLVYHAIKECDNAPVMFWAAFETGYHANNYDKQRIKKAVYRYILKRKGYAV